MANFKIGDIVTFRYPLPPGTRAHTPYPQVLVLHPDWQGLMHGLGWHLMTQDEMNVIRMLVDPFFEMQYRKGLQKRNPVLYAEMEKIITSPQTWNNVSVRNAKITSPQEFYRGVIRPFIRRRGWEPYRKYDVTKIASPRVITPARVLTGEESLNKWKKEREQITKKLQKIANKAKTAKEKKEVEIMKSKLDQATSMSQRKSILSRFADFIQFWKGPKGPRFF